MPQGLEIAVFNAASALRAAAAGADRLELCGGPYGAGGVTPSAAELAAVRGATELPVHCMLRPRSGDFAYDEAEFCAMKVELVRLAQQGANGVVFGILRSTPGASMTGQGGGGNDGVWEVNEQQCSVLCALAQQHGLRAVFHRAFDELDDWRAGLAAIAKCGFRAVLTAGGKGRAAESDRLVDMSKVAGDHQVELIIGGGIRSDNIQTLAKANNAPWWHSAAITDGGEDASEDEVRGLKARLGQVSNSVH